MARFTHEERMTARDTFAQRLAAGFVKGDPLAVKLLRAHPASRYLLSARKPIPWDVFCQVAGARIARAERDLEGAPQPTDTPRVHGQLAGGRRIISERVFE